MHSSVVIRPAVWDDLPTVARLHIAVWRQAYVGQVPENFLASINEADRLARWQESFKKAESNPNPLLGTNLAFVADRPVGFVAYGPGRDPDRLAWAEVKAIYVLSEAWGTGVGFGLFQTACEQFRAAGHDRTFLWALASNQRAIDSYVRWGGVVEPERHKEFDAGDGVKLKELSVRFHL